MPFDSTYCKGCYKQIATRIWNHHVGQPGTKCNQIHRQTFLSELNKQITEEILPNLDSKQDTDAGSNSDSLESMYVYSLIIHTTPLNAYTVSMKSNTLTSTMQIHPKMMMNLWRSTTLHLSIRKGHWDS